MASKLGVALIAILGALLAGCGGGGGAGNTTSANTGGNGGTVAMPVNNDPALQLTPGAINLTMLAGESQQVQVSVAVKRDIPGVVNVRVADPAGVIRVPVDVLSYGQYDYQANLNISEALPAGVYDGAVQIFLCKDDPAVCAQPIQGSPWRLPYHVEVKSFPTALTALVPVAGMSDWGMYQGGATHTGYVPLTIDAAHIAPRFYAAAPDAALHTQHLHSSAVSANGIVYFTRDGSLYAVSEQSGAVLWRQALSTGAAQVGEPTVYGGTVFVPVDDVTQGGVRLFNAATGALIRIVRISDASLFISPTVDAGTLYIRSNGGAFSAVDYNSGVSLYGQYNKYSSDWLAPYAAALDQDNVYFYNAGTIFQLDKHTGTVNASMRTFRSEYNDGYANNIGSVVLHSGKQALMVEEITYGSDAGTGTLFNFDFTTQKLSWSVPGTFRGNPAVNAGKLYVANDTAVVAMRLKDGGNEWTWPVPAEELQDGKASRATLIVTDNTLFASFANHVYAINLATHQTVWSYSRGGEISISRNGILYLAAPSALYAFNLR